MNDVKVYTEETQDSAFIPVYEGYTRDSVFEPIELESLQTSRVLAKNAGEEISHVGKTISMRLVPLYT